MNRNCVNACLAFCVLLLFSTRSEAQITANFGATPLSGCSPFVVQFFFFFTGGAVSWFWDLGNGTTSTLQNPSKTYTVSGTNAVTLTVTDAAGNTNTKTRNGFITVIPKPEVNFSSPDTLSGCAPKVVSFTPQVTNGIPGALTYTWDFGDGVLSTSANPTHTYTAVGNFDITLSVTNAQGCNRALTKTAYIKTGAKPQSGFSFSGNNACSLPITVSFGNTTTGSLLTAYQWNFGNGQTSTAINPTAIYSAAGTYAVRLISTAPGGGCTDTLVQNIVVSTAGPAASFTAPVSGCAGTPVSFTNISTPTTTTADWTFGDGTGSTALSPSKTYGTAGTYTVRLIAKSGNNCADTIMKSITINPAPTASFTPSPNPATGCSIPKTFTFTNTSVGAAGYNWSFGDGTNSAVASPSKTYTSFGTYNVTLTATGGNGCTTTSSSATVTLAAPSLSVNAIYTAGRCVPAGVSFSSSFSALDAGTTYAWTFGDGTTGTGASPAHSYTTAGSYTITLTATSGSGCTATATTLIEVGSKPTAAFTASPLTVCTNIPVTFTNTSTGGTTYSWTFGDGGTSTVASPGYAYGTQGVYTVTLVVSNNGCNDTMVRPNYITVTGPVAQFTDNFLCTNKALHNFTNTSTGATSYLWNFGDGTTSNATSPSHTYGASGSFDVQLNAISGACSSVITKRIYNYILNPQFSAVPLPVCKGQAVNFTLQNPAHMYAVAWNFGDGTGLPAGTPGAVSKTYNTAGTYTVTAYATDSAGCTDTVIKPAYVQVRGFAMGFKALPITSCPGTPITFTDTSLATVGGTITARTWSFGDGTTLTGNVISPVKTYAVAGTYDVKLVVTGSFGCSDSLLKPAYIVVAKPVASFTSTNNAVCQSNAVTFTNTSVGATSYTWDFGDSTTSTAPNPVKVYTSSGNYSVRLIATGAAGCKDTLTTLILVSLPIPLSLFTASDSVASCPPLAVQFGVTTPTPGVTYLWKFGNGAMATGTSPSTLYTTAGTYTAKLIATSTTGCKDSSTKTIQINGPAGTLSYTPPNGCAPVLVTFTVNATSTVSYTFDFDNGITLTSPSATATNYYSTGGLFKTSVILSNGAGCNVLIEASDTLRISSLKVGYTASATSVCLGKSVQFNDTSVSIAGGPITRLWTFGDGTTSTLANPSKTYAAPGTYTVKLRVNNANCADSSTKIITVLPVPTVSVLPNPAALCAGSSLALTATGAATYVWSPAAGLSCTACPNPTATPATTTAYTVIGTGANGCTTTISVPVVVNPIPVVTVAASQNTPCAGTPVTLTAGGAANYVWTPATGLSCTNCAAPVATPAATTTYVVTGTTAAGCTATAQVTIAPKLVPVLQVRDTAFCAGTSAPLLISGAATYVWSPATGLSCTTCANPTASPASTTTYTVIGTGTNGCTATKTVVVTVNPIPQVEAGPNREVCIDVPVLLNATGAATYVWSPATGLSCTLCASPTATLTNTTAYTVTGTSAAGCVGSANVLLTVIPRSPVSITKPPPICEDESVQLIATGGSSYSWSPAGSLSNANAADPLASPKETTTYTVIIKQGNCYVDTLTANVVVNPLPTVNGGLDRILIAGRSTQLIATGTGINSYKWMPGATLSCDSCSSTSATPVETTVYTITVKTKEGCTASDDVKLSVQCANEQMYLPNTFTPNGDGMNDVFYPRGAGIREVRSFRIYSRWGELLYIAENFSLNDEMKGWNGSFNNVPLKPDVYVWVVDAYCDTGEPLQRKGDIALVK